MKRIIILFVAISIISCKNRVNYDSSTYLTEEDTIRDSLVAIHAHNVPRVLETRYWG